MNSLLAQKIEQAIEFHRTSQFLQAFDMYQQVLWECPEHLVCATGMALVLQAMGDSQQAGLAWQRVLELDANNVAAHNNLGNMWQAQGRYDDAERAYRLALALQDDAMIHYNLANVLLTTGKVHEAIVHYRAALARNPDYVEAWGNLGNALERMADHGEAVVCYRRALSLRPDFVEAHNNLGNVYRAQGKWPEALAEYATAVDLRPQDAGIRCNFANALKAQNRVDEAIAAYMQVLQVMPVHAEAASNLADLLQLRQRWTEAIALYRGALALRPQLVEAWNNLGCALHTQGNLEAAIVVYSEALVLHPHSAALWYNLGNTQQQLWQMAAAVESYAKALAVQPDYLEAHNNLGNAWKALEHYPEAEAAYQQALALSPQLAQTHCNLAILYSTQKRYAEAERFYRQALALQPDMPVAARNLAAVLVQDGRLEEARAWMDRAYRGQCWFHEARYGVSRTVLVLLGVEKGNVPFAGLLPPQRNNTVEWMVDYAPSLSDADLPSYDIVFNALGEPDAIGLAGDRAAEFVARCEKPVINPPECIVRSARDRMDELYGGLVDVFAPPVWRMPEQSLPEAGVSWPLLVRPSGAHGGEGLVMVEDVVALAQQVQMHDGHALYVSPFVDYRSADGYFRKYRMIFVGGVPYPYHLAISRHWMVHYATAEMREAWKLAEEAEFLEHPEVVLGQRGMAAVAAIGERLGLDYGGADFALLPDGRILLFEANATMLVHPEKDVPELMFKNPYVERIYQAVDKMLSERILNFMHESRSVPQEV